MCAAAEMVTRATNSRSFKARIPRFTDSGGFGKLLVVKFILAEEDRLYEAYDVSLDWAVPGNQCSKNI